MAQLVYCATTRTSLVAQLEEMFGVSTTKDLTSQDFALRIAAAGRGGNPVPHAAIITTDIALNHTRQTALAVARQVRDHPGLAQVRVVVVDTMQQVGQVELYMPDGRVCQPSDDADLLRLCEQGAIPVIPNRVDLMEQIGKLLGLSRRVAQGFLIVVFSIKGGVGKTTMACGLAVALRRLSPRANVLLVDLDLQDGDLRMAAGLPDHVADLKGLFGHIGTMTEEIIRAHISWHEATGVGIIPAPRDTVFLNIETREMLELLRALRNLADFVIVDLDTTIHDLNTDVVRMALGPEAMVLGVVTPRPFEIDGGRRLADFLGQLPEVKENPEEIRRRVGIVVNRHDRRGYGREEVVREQVAAYLALPVVAVIPEDSEAIHAAQRDGQLYPQRRCAAWRGMLELAKSILALAEKEKEGERRVR